MSALKVGIPLVMLEPTFLELDMLCCRLLLWAALLGILRRSLLQALKSGPPRSNEVTVLRGFAAFVPCIPRRFEYEMEPEVLSYEWTDRAGTPLSDSRFLLKENGDLWLSNSQVQDTGVLLCHMRLRSGTRVYRHRLLVYDRTVLMHRVTFEAAGNIDDTGVVQMTDTLQRLARTRCCALSCSLEAVRFNGCHFNAKENEMCSFSITIKPINVFLDNTCDIHCYRSRQREILYKAEDAIKEGLTHWSKYTSLPRIPDPASIGTKHYVTCEVGFRLIPGSYCYPCKPGSFSGPKDTKCHPCPRNEWQDRYGQESCRPCPSGKITAKKGAKSFLLCYNTGFTGFFQRLFRKGQDIVKNALTTETVL